jgi:uncharacterized protein YyaL (SSP411 family)
MDSVARLLQVTTDRLSEAVTRGRQVLFDAREKRVRPGRDEKTLTAWNALMLKSFAEAGRAFSNPSYIETAKCTAEFLLSSVTHKTDSGLRLLRTYKDGKSKLNAYLEDYAIADALYHSTRRLMKQSGLYCRLSCRR